MMIKKCPKCGSARLISIVYGNLTEDGEESVRKGIYISGGCVMEQDSPTTACKDCGYQFNDLFSSQRQSFLRMVRKQDLMWGETSSVKDEDLDPDFSAKYGDDGDVIVLDVFKDRPKTKKR